MGIEISRAEGWRQLLGNGGLTKINHLAPAPKVAIRHHYPAGSAIPRLVTQENGAPNGHVIGCIEKDGNAKNLLSPLQDCIGCKRCNLGISGNQALLKYKGTRRGGPRL